MTNPPTFHDGEKTPKTRTAPDFSKFNVHDSFYNPITKTTSPGGERRRLSHQQAYVMGNSSIKKSLRRVI